MNPVNRSQNRAKPKLPLGTVGNANYVYGDFGLRSIVFGVDLMKIVFISNYFNHHQKPLCDALYDLLGDDFSFISTESVSTARVRLGYAQGNAPGYVCRAYLNSNARMRAVKLINDADAVVTGSAPEEYLAERLRMGKLVLRYSERPYKKKASVLKRLYHAVRFRLRDRGNRNVYLLCASAFTADDYRSVGMYRNRVYKWGYFPEVKARDIDRLLDRKKRNTILWCGRFIDWKHPDDVIRLAGKLKAEGYVFQVNMIGIGNMEPQLKHMAEEYGVSDVVTFLGSMPPERVRTYMEESGIYLFTSDRQEGWGAVLNEAMASGCAVVASDAAGATPYLVQDGINGSVYRSGNFDELLEQVRYLLRNPEVQALHGRMAYETMRNTWNGNVAAQRLLKLIEVLLNGERCPNVYEDGPCSYVDGSRLRSLGSCNRNE